MDSDGVRLPQLTYDGLKNRKIVSDVVGLNRVSAKQVLIPYGGIEAVSVKVSETHVREL